MVAGAGSRTKRVLPAPGLYSFAFADYDGSVVLQRIQALRGRRTGPMKIAYLTDHLLPHGTADTAQVLSMVSAFGRAGCEVELVVPSSWFTAPATVEQLAAYYQVEPNFKVRALRSLYPAIRGIEKVSHALRSSLARELTHVDVLYTRSLPAVCTALAFADRPVIYETYRPWPRQSRSKRWLFRRLMKQHRLAGLVLHSRFAAQSYHELGFDSGRTLVAYNGFDPKLLRGELSQQQARAACRLPANRFTITYAGRVSADKGLLLVLQLARALPQLQFVIVGSKGRGPVERKAAKLANVAVFDWKSPSDTLPYLYAADALLIPPTGAPLEHFGSTVLPIKTFLYMATGRPIVAAATADLLELLEDGRNAVLVPPDDVAAAAERLQQLSEAPELAKRIGDAARADSARFTWEARAQRVLEFMRGRLGAG